MLLDLFRYGAHLRFELRFEIVRRHLGGGDQESVLMLEDGLKKKVTCAYFSVSAMRSVSAIVSRSRSLISFFRF
jgi:hypothetical protein